MLRAVSIISIALTLLWSCSHNDSDAVVARPTAYPRLPVYDSVYTDCGLPGGFEVNSNATVTDITPSDRQHDSKWVDIHYPAYNATLHLTFTPLDSAVAERDRLLAARHERMMLNLGDNTADLTELRSPSGAETIVVKTLGRTLTPVQFISAGHEWMISGGVQFAGENLRSDSIAPLIHAVERDIFHSARRLK